MHPYLEKYFEDKNISVIFNAMGANQNLVKSYIKDTIDTVAQCQSKRSEYVKTVCYQSFYPEIQDRKKLTGFENFSELDLNFRKEIAPQIEIAQAVFSDNVNTPEHAESYKDALKTTLALYSNPLLYLSGGIDSELIAYAFLEANLKFTPVIFNWTNKAGEIQNTEDTKYAFDFCEKHSLTPIVETVDIETLWGSDEFKRLALDVQLVSSQLITHAWMTLYMNQKLPNSTHLFGGEVRYFANFKNSDHEITNLVTLTKVTPGYNNGTMTAFTFGTGSTAAPYYGAAFLNFTNILSNPYQSYSPVTWWTFSSSDSFSPSSGVYSTAPVYASAYTYTINYNGGTAISKSLSFSVNDNTNAIIDSGTVPGGGVTPLSTTSSYMTIAFTINDTGTLGAQITIISDSSLNTYITASWTHP